MNPSDKVDDFLAEAGAQWRAGQPSAPEPDLDRITDQRSGSVCLHIRDTRGIDTRAGLGFGNYPRLTIDPRRGEADLPRAVVVNR